MAVIYGCPEWLLFLLFFPFFFHLIEGAQWIKRRLYTKACIYYSEVIFPNLTYPKAYHPF